MKLDPVVMPRGDDVQPASWRFAVKSNAAIAVRSSPNPDKTEPFGRREHRESKADFAAMPGAVHPGTRAARGKIQRRYRGAQQPKKKSRGEPRLQ
jgi:hypothetical protein